MRSVVWPPPTMVLTYNMPALTLQRLAALRIPNNDNDILIDSHLLFASPE
jgi:adenylate kinase